MIAFAAGLLFGLVYELLRVIRLILRFRGAVFLCDVAFFILAGFFVCKLSEFLGSYVRMYTVLGFGAGVFSYIVTVGRVFNALEKAVLVLWKKTLGRAIHKFGRFVKKNVGILLQKCKAILGKINKHSSEFANNRLKRLHLRDKKMYNNKGMSMIGEGEKYNVIKAKVRKSG